MLCLIKQRKHAVKVACAGPKSGVKETPFDSSHKPSRDKLAKIEENLDQQPAKPLERQPQQQTDQPLKQPKSPTEPPLEQQPDPEAEPQQSKLKPKLEQQLQQPESQQKQQQESGIKKQLEQKTEQKLEPLPEGQATKKTRKKVKKKKNRPGTLLPADETITVKTTEAQKVIEKDKSEKTPEKTPEKTQGLFKGPIPRISLCSVPEECLPPSQPVSLPAQNLRNDLKVPGSKAHLFPKASLQASLRPDDYNYFYQFQNPADVTVYEL